MGRWCVDGLPTVQGDFLRALVEGVCHVQGALVQGARPLAVAQTLNGERLRQVLAHASVANHLIANSLF
jgi:hypothetical protein